jgi:4-amino-4-deoxy-L-arabinose transferase-like glycosyltransferase
MSASLGFRVPATAVTRRIGPLGTAVRAIAGLAAIAYPFATHGIGLWDIAAALVAFPALAALLYVAATRAYERAPALRESSRAARTWTVSIAVLVLLLAITTALTFVSPVDAGAIFLFLGSSLLVVAARGDAGCEVLGVVNALAGRREDTGCIAFAPLDAVETRLEAR